jgi:hypothetical protein
MNLSVLERHGLDSAAINNGYIENRVVFTAFNTMYL